MKKRRIYSFAALLIALSMIFAGCSEKTPLPEGEGGSDIAVSNEETTAEKAAKPQYSPEDKLIALTYDDGPHSVHTNKILDILEENGAKATFFIVGYNIDKNIDTIKRAQAIGCEIGNHSNDHKILTKCDGKTVRSQVNVPNQRIKELTGIEMSLFRAPGGAFKGVTDQIGMPLIQWSIDTEDWKSKDAAHKDRTEEERNAELKRIADKVIADAEKGDIILMHDIYGFTADLSAIIIPGLTEKGFKVVTVSDMYEAYGKPLNDGEVYYNISFAQEFSPVHCTEVLEAGDYKVKTKGGNLNVRIEPKQDSQSIGKLSNGDSVTVVKSVPGWAFVRISGASGWVNAAYLTK